MEAARIPIAVFSMAGLPIWCRRSTTTLPIGLNPNLGRMHSGQVFAVRAATLVIPWRLTSVFASVHNVVSVPVSRCLSFTAARRIHVELFGSTGTESIAVRLSLSKVA